jgi:predicted DNA binding CopG/RHH family protein
VTNVNIEVPAKLHTRLKLKAVREGKTIQQVVVEILEQRRKR